MSEAPARSAFVAARARKSLSGIRRAARSSAGEGGTGEGSNAASASVRTGWTGFVLRGGLQSGPASCAGPRVVRVVDRDPTGPVVTCSRLGAGLYGLRFSPGSRSPSRGSRRSERQGERCKRRPPEGDRRVNAPATSHGMLSYRTAPGEAERGFSWIGTIPGAQALQGGARRGHAE